VADDLRERLGIEAELVPNGWDPDIAGETDGGDDVTGLLDSSRVSLVYTGRFGRGREPAPLVEALGQLARAAPDAAARIELVVAGPLLESERELLATDVSPARIVIAGSLTRERAVALQRAAGALLLIAHPTRSQLANYKLYEYLPAGRPVLALAAGTEAGRIAEAAGSATVPADDVPAIMVALRKLAEGGLPAPNPAARESYSYPAVAQRMADAVELAISRAPAAHAPR
jgi:hypothetical protein